MKGICYSIALLLLVHSVNAQTHKLTTEDYKRAEQFLSYNTNPFVDWAYPTPNWLDGDKFWYKLNGKVFLVDPAISSKTETTAYGNKQEQAVQILRRRRSANEVASPDGKKVVYIKDWNLWVKDVATQKETQLTTDGVADYGYATDNAGWKHSDAAIVSWSPDSKKIATFQQDQRKVGNMYLVTTNVGTPRLEQWKYPLPGDKYIPMIRRVIVDVENPKVISLNIPPIRTALP